MIRLRSWIQVLLLALSVLATAEAQVTAAVAPDDPVLQRIERLAAEGAVQVTTGQGPRSRRETAVLLAAAAALADSLDVTDPARAGRIRALVALDGTRFADGGAGTRALDLVAAEVVTGGRGRRTIPFGGTGDGPIGRLDAITDPLLERRLGRVYARASTVAIETSHRLQLGRHAAAVVAPRVWTGTGAPPRECTADAPCPLETDLDRARAGRGATLQRAALTLGMRNVRIVVGREHLLLGQGMSGGGLMLSDNAPALDMVRVASDAPFRLPAVLRRLGRMHATAFVADLGAERDVPHAKLAGWKVSVLATPTLEWGVSVLSQQGGRGAPEATALQRVADLLPLIDVLLLQDRDLLFSNKLAGLDARIRFSGSRGLELYWEGVADDFDIRRIASSLTEDAAHVVGLSLSRLSVDGMYRLDVEGRNTGIRFYQHEQFTAGLTVRRFLLGDPIGPRARGIVARLSRDHGGRSPLALTLTLEELSDDRYVVSADQATAANWRFVKVEDRPEEVRGRAVVTWLPALRGAMLQGRVDAGWEYVRRPGFTEGSARNALLRIGATARF